MFFFLYTAIQITMSTREAEKYLSILYSISSISSIISIICLVLTWLQWSRTLNSCIDFDCGCILYGVNTFRIFLGGNERICQFGTYALLPSIFLSLCFGIYHGYRTLFSRNLREPRIVTNSMRHRDW